MDTARTPQPLSTPTDEQASRFLSQAAFGGNDTHIAQVKQQGYVPWLRAQMNMPVQGSHRDWLIDHQHNDGKVKANISGRGIWDRSLWRKLLTSPDVVRQRMVLALTEHFVISGDSLTIQWRSFAVANYLDTLEQHAFGNFRDLLEAVTLTSAMGTYLSMKGNKKADPATQREPDENYAREIMQLFTIGLHELNDDGSLKLRNGQAIETYTNEDTKGLAAVFTGWANSNAQDPETQPSRKLTAIAYRHGLPMVLRARDHSSEAKRFLGTVIPANTDGQTSLRIALDTLFQHPNTPPYIAKFLIQRFVTSNPTGTYIQRVAQAFKNNGQGTRGDLKAVLQAVLMDPEARTPASAPHGGKLREPMIRYIQWARTFGAYTDDRKAPWSMPLKSATSSFGQMPLHSPSVFNFFRPGYIPPNSPMAQAKLLAPEFQITSEPTVVEYINFMASTVNNARSIKVDYTQALQLAHNTRALLNRLDLWFTGKQLQNKTLAKLEQALNTIDTRASDTQLQNRLHAAILMVMSCPEYLVQK